MKDEVHATAVMSWELLALLPYFFMRLRRAIQNCRSAMGFLNTVGREIVLEQAGVAVVFLSWFPRQGVGTRP